MVEGSLTSTFSRPLKTFQRRMETLNLRWEELGVKEEQLKAHIQKFEQFIQVWSGVGRRLEDLHSMRGKLFLPST